MRGRRRKADLKAWSGRLKREYPEAAFIWRLEFQKRGAPHFHMLLYGVNVSMKVFRQWLATSWYEVVDSGDERHQRAGTGAERMDSFRAAMNYASYNSLTIFCDSDWWMKRLPEMLEQ